jgi:hypothetical protein
VRRLVPAQLDKEVGVRRKSRLTPLLVVGAVSLAAAWGFAAQTAVSGHYHTNCVGHGLVHGGSTTDGSFHSRVESGCGGGWKTCSLYTSYSLRGTSYALDPSSCNFWVGTGTECASEAHVDYDGIFSSHIHWAHNWCL